MKVLKSFCLILFAAIFFAGCTSSGSSGNQLELADYTFTMYGNGGMKICSGVLNMKNISSAKNPEVSGTYSVTNWYQDDFPAKSTMGGEFSGNIDYSVGKLFINMNPKIADANVFFNAGVYSSFYQGEWNYSTFRGPMVKGELLIKKK
ncbi:MAG: hypothetical protein K1X86_09440 [Ignavibacteria bacterium]|nr:hypothetical protein [Ignavibacteria bacterium]